MNREPDGAAKKKNGMNETLKQQMPDTRLDDQLD